MRRPMGQKLVIAADVGGTNLKYSVVTPGGDLHYVGKEDISALRKSEDLIGVISSKVEHAIQIGRAEGEIVGIGLAIPGYTNQQGIIIGGVPHLPALKGKNPKFELEKLGYPVFTGNDVTLAALGEYYFGFERAVSSLAFMAIGTGVGGGLVVDGKLYEGVNGAAAEFGHICVVDDGFDCVCGNKGCLERYVSSIGLVNMLRAEMERKSLTENMENLLSSGNGEVSPLEFYNAVERKDTSAVRVHRQLCRLLAKAAGIIANIIVPQVIVLGGGFIMASNLILPEVQAQMRHYCKSEFQDKVRVVSSKRNEYAGVVGAASYVLYKLKGAM